MDSIDALMDESRSITKKGEKVIYGPIEPHQQICIFLLELCKRSIEVDYILQQHEQGALRDFP